MPDAGQLRYQCGQKNIGGSVMKSLERLKKNARENVSESICAL